MSSSFPSTSGPVVRIKKNPKVDKKGQPVPFFEKELDTETMVVKKIAEAKRRRS
jgi:hypothetical protein